MTLLSQTSKNVFVGDGATVLFSYTFRIFTDADLLVTIQDTSVTPQTEITLVLTSDYTVTGAGDASGGTITLLLTGQLSSAPSATDNITIQRALPITQPTDYVENDPFPAESHETALDRGRMIDQQLQEELDRAIKLAVNITGVSTVLPTPLADAPIGWNAAADALVNNPSLTNLSQIDSGATPDFIGASGGDGVLRVSGLITYVDGGDFVTLGITSSLVDHDDTLNFLTAEHFTMLDEDDLVSDSDTQAATQQSIRAFVLAQIGGNNEFTELLDTPASFAASGLFFVRVNTGATALEFVAMTASLVPIVDGGSIITATEVEGALQENRIAINLNTAKVTNATHTGEITGATVLTLESTAITNKSSATVASGDTVLISDLDDSGNLKEVTVQSIADLAGASGIIVQDEGTPLTTAVTLLNFAGAGVTVTEPIADQVLITIPGGGGSSLTQDVNQTTHGFSTGEWIYHNGTIYALADASAAATAESIGVVSAVAGANDFTVQFGGRITGLSGLTIGEAHFLSETPGTITATAPSTEDSIIKPVLIADSATTGFIFNMRGIAVTSTTSFFQTIAVGAGVAPSIAHNLGNKFLIAQVYDENDDLIQPDDITLTDDDNLVVDLTSFGTRGGDYTIVILDVGTTQSSVASDLSISGQAVNDLLQFNGTNWVAAPDIAVKAWIKFSGTGVISIFDSFNVSSIVDDGVGSYSIFWDTDFASPDYSAVGSTDNRHIQIGSPLAGDINIFIRDESNNLADSGLIYIIAIGDQ